MLIPRTGYFRQDGRAVQMFAIKRTREGYERIVEARRDEPEAETRPLHFVGHQANLRVLEQVCQRCAHRARAPPRERRAVRQHRRRERALRALDGVGEVAAEDDVAVSVVGGGLTWARALLRFGDVK